MTELAAAWINRENVYEVEGARHKRPHSIHIHPQRQNVDQWHQGLGEAVIGGDC